MKVYIVTLSLFGTSAAAAAPPAPPIQQAECAQACLAVLQLGPSRPASDSDPADANLRLTHEVDAVDWADAAAVDRAGVLTTGYQATFDTLALADVGDPFRGGLTGKALARDLRADDSISYQARVGGLKTGSRWSKGDVDGSPAGRAWGMTVGAKLGALSLRAAHQNRNVAKITRLYQPVLSMTARNSIIAANMRFRWGTAYAAYSANRGWGSSPLFNPDNPYGAHVVAPPSTDSRDVLIGVAVPLSRRTTLLASYIRRNDRDLADQDARQIALGATYALNRKLDFYAAYSHIQYLDGTPLAGSAGSGGAINVGMRRGF